MMVVRAPIKGLVTLSEGRPFVDGSSFGNPVDVLIADIETILRPVQAGGAESEAEHFPSSRAPGNAASAFLSPG